MQIIMENFTDHEIVENLKINYIYLYNIPEYIELNETEQVKKFNYNYNRIVNISDWNIKSNNSYII